MNQLPAVFCLLIAFSTSLSFSQDKGLIPPINISFNPDQLKKLDFGTDSLNGDKVLFQLFPAPMNEDDPELSEWKTSAYWSCSSCPKIEMTTFEDDEESEKEVLPFDGNYTSCTNVLYYQSEKGSLRAIVSFSTSQMNDGTGRFTRGLLSLANFEKQNGSWRLIHFNPFVNFQGSFTLASPVDEVMISKTGKTYFLIHGGEANGVSPEDYWPLYQGLYVINGEHLVEELHIPAASCKENNNPIGSVWNTEITDIEEEPSGTVIKIETGGLIVKEYNWGLPEALRYISSTDFELLPGKFTFTAAQEFTRSSSSLKIEKPVVTIHYTDSKGMSQTKNVITQNTRIK